MNSYPPTTSVIMATYQSEAYISEAISSILTQTYTNFELIIVYDRSSDRTLEIIKSFTDPRVKIIENAERLGPVTSRNTGIRAARGAYITIMDADDISLPQRLEKQVEYMEQHPDIALSGTWSRTIGDGTSHTTRHLTDADELKANLLFRTSFTHSSIMIRKAFLDQHALTYTEGRTPPFPEDFDLYTRISSIGKLGNIPKILLLLRKHEGQSSREKVDIQIGHARNIIAGQLEQLGIAATDTELDVLISLKRYQFTQDPHFMNAFETLCIKIITANELKKVYLAQALRRVCGYAWLEAASAYAARTESKKIWRTFWNSPLRRMIPVNLRTFARVGKIYFRRFI
jgi:glycosyltransferase involved in cell wall biosynthesis